MSEDFDWSDMEARYASFHGDRDVKFAIGEQGTPIKNGDMLDFGLEKDAEGQYIVVQEILKSIDVQGEKFQVRNSQKKATSSKCGPKITLKCSATDSSMNPDKREALEKIQQFLEVSCTKPRSRTISAADRQCIMNVKQNTDTWKHLRYGRITSTKVGSVCAKIEKVSRTYRKKYY